MLWKKRRSNRIRIDEDLHKTYLAEYVSVFKGLKGSVLVDGNLFEALMVLQAVVCLFVEITYPLFD